MSASDTATLDQTAGVPEMETTEDMETTEKRYKVSVKSPVIEQEVKKVGLSNMYLRNLNDFVGLFGAFVSLIALLGAIYIMNDVMVSSLEKDQTRIEENQKEIEKRIIKIEGNVNKIERDIEDIRRDTREINEKVDKILEKIK